MMSARLPPAAAPAPAPAPRSKSKSSAGPPDVPRAEVEIDLFLTIKETMALLKVSRATVDRLRAKGVLKATRKLGYPRILGSSVKALLDVRAAG